jgi:hypothetical protein
VRFAFCGETGSISGIGTYSRRLLYQGAVKVFEKGIGIMLVERGLQVMNVEVVGDAYAIASNYLRRSGALPDNLVTDDRLLGLIVQMFRRGEFNRLRLANLAIAKFEAGEHA